MIERKSIQTLVYEELKRNIMSMKLEPGQTMSTQEIATKLNVSRTPVREAFLRLQSEGLVEMIPQRETMVSKISLKRVEQEKFIRECLEMGVIRKFMDKSGCEVEENMAELIQLQKKCGEEKDFVGFLEADDQFHKVLFDVTGQEMAWETIASRNGHYNRLRILYVQRDTAMQESIEQHHKIATLLESGSREEAARALSSHVRRLDIDEAGLIAQYPDYFESEGERSWEKPDRIPVDITYKIRRNEKVL